LEPVYRTTARRHVGLVGIVFLLGSGRRDALRSRQRYPPRRPGERERPLDSWDAADIEEIGETVSPWFGNTFSDRHNEPPTEWVDRYEYYTLWELFEKVAAVFREESRYDALETIHADLLATIEENLPPEEERPTAVLAGMSDIEVYTFTR